MQWDSVVYFDKGEKKPVYFYVTASAGSVTVLGTPSPTFTLLDWAGGTVTGFGTVAVTGTAAASGSVNVWYNLDTSGTATPAARYFARADFAGSASADTMTRNYSRYALVVIQGNK